MNSLVLYLMVNVLIGVLLSAEECNLQIQYAAFRKNKPIKKYKQPKNACDTPLICPK